MAMSEFNVSIEITNAAFDPEEGGDASQELARILRGVADRVEEGTLTGRITDINGNTVGAFNTAP